MFRRIFIVTILSLSLSISFSVLTSKLMAQGNEGANIDQSSLVAKKAEKKAGKKAAGGKEKFINREVKLEKRSTKINFEDTDIAGERKGSLGSMISDTQADKEVDLIKIRYNWHPEMKESTSSLETGKSE